MATKVILPFLGQTMEEGTITKWIKQEGEAVQKGEPLFEVMTDKANMEVEAPESGILRKIIAQEGAVVPVKEIVAVISMEDESIDEFLASPSDAPVEASSSAAEQIAETPAPVREAMTEAAKGRIFASPRARKVAAERGIDLHLLAGSGTGPQGRIVEKDVLAYAQSAPATPRMSPLASKVAAEVGVDVASISGTGPGGKVMKEDVLRAATPTRPTGPRGIGQVIPYTGMRKAVGENVAMSVRTAPHVTFVTEVDMTAASQMRDQLLPEMQKRYGVRISLTSMVVKATALAILDNPIINSTLVDNKEIVIHDEINVCVAVALENGLVTPVIRDTDRKGLHEIAAEIKQMAAKARDGKLTRDDLQGGTFTVSSLSSYPIDAFNPIINPPQSAILGVCRVVDKPVVVDGQIQVRSMMNTCLVWDHRVMDGVPAAKYVARLKEILESPYLLML